MKKVWSAVLALTLVGALTACGGKADTTDSAASDTQADTAATGAAVDLAVDATNFKFDQAEYRVKAGDTVNLTFTSSDGMHGLQVNDLGLDLQDGQGTTFIAEKGEYDIVCSVMCGSGHADMTAKLIVE